MSPSKDLSKFECIIFCKCPRCRKGDIFTNTPFSVKYGRRANVYCPVCNLRFEQEPGFFEGAMYFNYALNIALMFVSGVATYRIMGDPSPYWYFGTTATMVVLFVSFTSRLSKSMMLHFFGNVQYKPHNQMEHNKDGNIG